MYKLFILLTLTISLNTLFAQTVNKLKVFKDDGTETIFFVEDIDKITFVQQKLAIGDYYKGGIIFYIDNTGLHGFAAAQSDQSTSAEWGCYQTTISGADGIEIGTGAQNTIDIENGCTTDGTAADICANLTLNGNSDWFLPSRDELNEMYINKSAINATALLIGGSSFEETEYWSSSESTEESGNGEILAWLQNFSDGTGNYYYTDKYINCSVRAVRAF